MVNCRDGCSGESLSRRPPLHGHCGLRVCVHEEVEAAAVIQQGQERHAGGDLHATSQHEAFLAPAERAEGAQALD